MVLTEPNIRNIFMEQSKTESGGMQESGCGLRCGYVDSSIFILFQGGDIFVRKENFIF